jgi:hypothetical protein
MLSDTDTLSFALTYGGTLVIASVMFLFQLTAIGILLAVAGIARLVVYPIQAGTRSSSRPAAHENDPGTGPGSFTHST